ncbi:MAG: hypothetical protein IMZ55_03955 [Acidobacteria bacterium]|nr:hypothetical protein [Acidobacteriota bacterium]
MRAMIARRTVLAIVLPVGLLASCVGLRAEPRDPQAQVQPLAIHPSAEGWDAPGPDVEKVLRSAADALWAHFPGRSLKPILVEPQGGPIVLFARGPNGEYRVRLSTGKTYWAQYAFQFAHEFCHILCDFKEGDESNKWFEESVCETASLYALRQMSRTWRTDPPYPHWTDFAPHLRSYAEERLKDARLPRGTTLAAWYREHEATLRKDACQRDLNRVVAGELLALFEKEPRRWEALTWLNAAPATAPRTFEQYLADWHAQCPPAHQGFVRQVAERFGVRLAAK